MYIKKYILPLIFFVLLSYTAYGQNQYLAEDFKLTLKPAGQYAIISFELKNNAKFYWRNPGELGLPTKFNFTKSINLKNAEIFWPIPEIYLKDNIASYVYKNNTDFIIKLIPNNPNQNIELNANIHFSICKEGCSTHEINLSDIIRNDSSNVGLIMSSLAKAPHPNGSENLTINKIEQEIIDNKHWLSIQFTNQQPILNPQIFLDLPEYINFEPDEFNLITSKDDQVIRLPFEINNKKYSKIEDKIYLNLVADNGYAVELEVLPTSLTIEDNENSFLWIMLIALIGGLILNVMPCVLPVLALKILQLVKLSEQDKNLVRKSLLAQSTGIIITFIFFALITYGLKFIGYQAGLGIHFQQPFYLITMILILSLIAISLLSDKEFTISIPNFILNVFHIKSEQIGILGFFASGILSTLLAIPCTAPFVTIAIGYALTTDFVRMLLIFIVMGIGMSLPYIVMAIFPKTARLLPRPGAWMITFKKILGIALITTSIWLIYVISTQLGYKAAITIFLLILLIKFIITEREILNSKARSIILVILIILSYFLPHNLYVEKQYNETIAESVWQEYNPALIPSLIDEGYVVVVNISASWCSTCGLNNITTIENISVINAMKKLKVIAMKADISKNASNEVIDLMKLKNHHGIPFTLIYSEQHPKGKTLPTILTPGIFMSAIKNGLK